MQPDLLEAPPRRGPVPRFHPHRHRPRRYRPRFSPIVYDRPVWVEPYSPPAESRVSGLGRIRLGQGPPRLRVIVTDRRGEPAPGIGVAVLSPSNIGEGTTDEDGVVMVSIPEGKTEAVVLAMLPEGEVRQRVLLAPLGMQTVSFRSVRKITGAVVTTVEGVAAGAGIGMIVVGTLLGEVFGDILTGIGGSVTAAAVYSAISRHM